MSLKFKNRLVSDFAALVSAYSSQELASPTRSTVPLLAFWARPEARIAELSASLGLAGPGTHDFRFEHTVSVQRGSGKASCTDLMILGQSAAVAIESKFTEPPYETVAEWLGSPAPPNRELVLGGWLQLIKDAASVKLSPTSVADYPYQLVHRTASACHPKALRRWVVYQLFSETRFSYYHDHLAHLAHALREQASLKLGVLLTPPELTPEFLTLKNRWASGERDLSASVRSGLVASSLFKFNSIDFTECGSPRRTGVAG
jgi:hypothetical protein